MIWHIGESYIYTKGKELSFLYFKGFPVKMSLKRCTIVCLLILFYL